MANRPPKQTPRKSTNPKKPTSSSSTNPSAAAAAKTSNPSPNPAAPTSASNTAAPTSSSNTAAPTSSSNPSQTTTLQISPTQWAEWRDKAKNKKWDEWSFKPNPTGAIIPDSPSLFCKLHDQLAHVTPVDSVYAQTPCSLLQNRRFNLKLDGRYFLHSQRQLDSKKDTVRKIAGSTAKWKNAHGWRMVAGKNGEAVGVACDLVYMYKQGKGQPKPPAAMWSAVEYVSINNMDGASSIVVLSPKNETWIELEAAVEVAEHNLARSYQNLMDAQDGGRGKVSNMEVSVSDNLAILGSKIEQLEVGRRQIKELEEKYSGVVVAENQGVQQVGDDLQTSDLHVATPANIGFVEVVRNLEVTSSRSDVASAAVIERDHGVTSYFSVLSNKKEKRKADKEKAQKEMAEKEMAEKEKAMAEKAMADKAKAEKEKAEAEKEKGKKN